MSKKTIYETLSLRLSKFSEKYNVQKIDENSLIQKILANVDDQIFEQFFKESISITDRLDALKKLLNDKKLGDLDENDSKLIEDMLFLKPIKKVKLEKAKPDLVLFKE